jgi:hypothetical protein
MHFKKVFKTPKGLYEFSGEFNEDELRFLVEVGVAFLLREGAIPIKAVSDEELASMLEPNSQEH